MTERLKPNGEPYKTKWYKPRENDKRKTNGNNGTRRGQDKKKRKVALDDKAEEEKAGLRARMNMVFEYYVNRSRIHRLTGIQPRDYDRMLRIGMISRSAAYKIHKHKIKSGGGFTASFCRPDLKFDANGKPIVKARKAKQPG